MSSDRRSLVAICLISLSCLVIGIIVYCVVGPRGALVVGGSQFSGGGDHDGAAAPSCSDNSTTLGSGGFDKDYWDRNFDEPMTMDGIANAKEHASYVQALFRLDRVAVDSIVDLGFGFGVMLQSFVAVFSPTKALGIEPSQYMFDRVSANDTGFKAHAAAANIDLRLQCIDIRSWCEAVDDSVDSSLASPSNVTVFDLGLCNSVFQYLGDDGLRAVSPCLSRHVRYLYMTVPTEIEMQNEKRDLNFEDPYAIVRTQADYVELLRDDWAFVSNRLLESKHFFNNENTKFQNLLYRFT